MLTGRLGRHFGTGRELRWRRRGNRLNGPAASAQKAEYTTRNDDDIEAASRL
jgi:hypothetical protein